MSAFSWDPLQGVSFILFLQLFFGYLHLYFTQTISVSQLCEIEMLSPNARSFHNRLPFVPIFLLFKVSLPSSRVTRSHFALSSNKRALCLPLSFPISGLTRLRIHQDFPGSPGEPWRSLTRSCLLFLFPGWLSLLFSVDLTPSSPCSYSNPCFSRQGAALAHLDSFPSHNLVIWTNRSVLCFDKNFDILSNCSRWGAGATHSYFSS